MVSVISPKITMPEKMPVAVVIFWFCFHTAPSRITFFEGKVHLSSVPNHHGAKQRDN